MPSVQQQLKAVDRCREEILQTARALDAEAMTVRPQPDAWSVLEIIEHLVLSEEDVLKGLPEDASLEPQPRSVRSRVLYWVVLLILRFPIPVKTPSPGMVPRRKHGLEELAARWEANHAWIRKFVEGPLGSDTTAAVFSHPVSGPLTTLQAIRMLRVHMDRHRRQLENVVSGSAS